MDIFGYADRTSRVDPPYKNITSSYVAVVNWPKFLFSKWIIQQPYIIILIKGILKGHTDKIMVLIPNEKDLYEESVKCVTDLT